MNTLLKVGLVLGGLYMLSSGGVKASSPGDVPKPTPPPLPPANKPPTSFVDLRAAVSYALDHVYHRGLKVDAGVARDGLARYMTVLVAGRKTPLPPELKPLIGNLWDAIMGKEPSDEAIALITGQIATLAKVEPVLESAVQLTMLAQLMRWVSGTNNPVPLFWARDLAAVMEAGVKMTDAPGGGNSEGDDSCVQIPRDFDVIVADPDAYNTPWTKAAAKLLADYGTGTYCAYFTGPFEPSDLTDVPEFWASLGTPPGTYRWLAAEIYFRTGGGIPVSWVQLGPWLTFVSEHLST